MDSPCQYQSKYLEKSVENIDTEGEVNYWFWEQRHMAQV